MRQKVGLACGLRLLSNLAKVPSLRCHLVAHFFLYLMCWSRSGFCRSYSPLPLNVPVFSIRSAGPKLDARPQLLDSISTMAFAVQYLPEIAVLLLLICIIWLWQRRKLLDSFQSGSCADEIRQEHPWDIKHPWDIEQHGKKLIEGRTWFSKSSIHPGATYLEEASSAGIWDPSVTSGQLADLVQGHNRQKHTARSRTHLSQDRASSQRSCLISSPWPHDAEEHSRVIDTDLIELYHDSNLHEVWRRRLMDFVGQQS